MPQSYCLYIVFSSTPNRMGRFIRLVTHDEYNHVSVALEAKPHTLYSFARHYRNAPFYGGFVRESCERYQNGGREAVIRVCAIPITETQQNELLAVLEGMSRDADRYVYNMLSAACSVLHKKVVVPNAYTCVEFATYLLGMCGLAPMQQPKRFFSVGMLAEELRDRCIYEGTVTGYMAAPTVGEDTFFEEKSLRTRCGRTLSANAKLLSLLAKGTFSRRQGIPHHT